MNRGTLLAFLLYVVVGLVVVAGFLDLSELDRSTYLGDHRLHIWAVAWQNHILLEEPLALFDANIFHPNKGTLAYSEHCFFLSLLTFPLYMLTQNAVLAFNLVAAVMPPLSAFTMFLLIRKLVQSWGGAFFGGLVFGYANFRLLHFPEHIHMVALALIPLAVFCLYRWIALPSWKNAAIFGFVFLAQVLTSWYVTYFMLWILSAYGVFELFHQGGKWWKQSLQLALAVAVAMLLALPFLLPYREHVADTSPRVPLYRAEHLTDHLLPSRHTCIGNLLGGNGAPLRGENALYVGGMAFLFAGIGIFARRSERYTLPSSALVVMGFLFSLGADIEVLGTPIKLPYGYLIDVFPFLRAFRVPQRFAVVTLFGVSVLAGSGMGYVLSRLRSRWSAIVLTLACGWTAAEAINCQIPRAPLVEPPAVYRWLSNRTEKVLLELPDYLSGKDYIYAADYQFFSTLHWKSLVNGSSRFRPPNYDHFMVPLQRFPDPTSFEKLRQLEVDLIVVHGNRYPVEEWRVRKDLC